MILRSASVRRMENMSRSVTAKKRLPMQSIMENPEISLFWQEKDMKITRRSKVRSILWMKES